MAKEQDGRTICTVGMREVTSSWKILLNKSEGEKSLEKTKKQMAE